MKPRTKTLPANEPPESASIAVTRAARAIVYLVAAASLALIAELGPASAETKPKSSLPPSSYPLPPPDASPSSIFKPDVGKPFTQTGPRIEYQPPTGIEIPGSICGPGEIRGMNGRCIR